MNFKVKVSGKTIATYYFLESAELVVKRIKAGETYHPKGTIAVIE